MIISIFNQKGGVAKTTTATNLACALSERDKRVCLIDFDPQANSTNALGIDDEALEYKQTIMSVLEDYKETVNDFKADNIRRVIQHTDFGVDIIPTDIRLCNAEKQLDGVLLREMALANIIAPVVDNYDYIIIDCPPSLGLLSINALTASDGIIIPVYPSIFSLKGLKELMNTIIKTKRLKAALGKKIEIMGVLFTKYDGRISKHREIRELVESNECFAANDIFKLTIRTNAELEYAQDSQKPINFFNRSSNGHVDYMALADEVIKYGNK